jgi:DNA-binding CsgD family transcriptional regulator
MSALLERAGELEAIARAARDAAHGAGAIVVIEGLPGIGKTALLDSARESAAKLGMETRSARGGELEQDLGFGVVRQLFAGASPPPDSELFSGPARFAAPLLGVELDDLAGAPQSPGDAVSSSLYGLYWLTVNLAERRPLALLVDDIQWADAASSRFLVYLARRLEGLPVLLAIAGRPSAAGEAALGDAAVCAELVAPGPLSAEAAAELVRAIAPGASDESCRACHDLSGGNPFYLRELAHGLIGDGGGAEDAGALADWSPEGVTRAVRRRLAGLSPAARDAARAAAVLGQRAELRHVAALAELDIAAAGAAADELRSAGLLGPPRQLEFLHPILRTAVYDDLPAGARAGRHGRAARLLAEDGVTPERVAVQLAGAERTGDPWACDQLVAAARESLARGAPEAAASHLRRALEEPPPTGVRFQVLFELGAAEATTFQAEASAEHLLQAYANAGDDGQRLQAAMLYALVEYLGARGSEGVHFLRELLKEAQPGPGLAARIEAQIIGIGSFQVETRPLVSKLSESLIRRVERGETDDPAVLATAAVELATIAAPTERVVDLARRAIGGLEERTGLTRDFDLSQAVWSLMAADALDEAIAILDGELEDARERGSAASYAIWSAFRAYGNLRRGAIYDAEVDAGAAYAISKETATVAGIVASAAYLVKALVERGELHEAERIVGDAGLAGPPATIPDLYPGHLFLHSRGILRAAGGDGEAGLEDLLECGRRELATDRMNPAFIPWRSTAAGVLAQTGDVAPARRLAREELDLARQFGAPSAVGVALRTCALIEGGDTERDSLAEAVENLEGSPARLEHGRALASLGDLHRREGRCDDARRVLREALELAHLCGAAALEADVVDALHAVGARPRRAMLTGPAALTPSERRVADLAARGMTNREIAATLFVTVRTVESHLVSAFRKLGIDSRGKLADALTREPTPRSAAPVRR